MIIKPNRKAVAPAGGGGGFSPLSLANLIGWYKADRGLFSLDSGGTAVTTDGSTVGRWEDQSGHGHHLIQAASGQRPLLKALIINSKPVLRFDGVDDYLRAVYTNTGYPYTVFLVYKSITIGSGSHDIIFDGGDVVGATLASDSAPQTYTYAHSVTHAYYAGNICNGVFGYVTCTFSTATNGSKLRLNGSTLAQDSGTDGNIGGFTLAALGNLSRSPNIDVAELVTMASVDATDIANCEAYLASEYAL